MFNGEEHLISERFNAATATATATAIVTMYSQKSIPLLRITGKYEYPFVHPLYVHPNGLLLILNANRL